MKQMQHIFQQKGMPGYFGHWKGVWVHQKGKVNMDADEGEGASGGSVEGGASMRKISKLQWLVQEMQGQLMHPTVDPNRLGTSVTAQNRCTTSITHCNHPVGQHNRHNNQNCLYVHQSCMCTLGDTPD